MNQDKTFLGTEPIGQLLRQLAIPTVIAQLVNMLYNIVDRIYIGHIPGDGDLALTGVGVCLPLILIISAFAALVASGGAPRASIYMGRQDHETAERILGGCFALQICICAGYGRQRRGSGNHSVSGNLLYLGAAVSDGAENAAAAEEGEHPTDAKAHPALCGAGNRHIYHAGQ